MTFSKAMDRAKAEHWDVSPTLGQRENVVQDSHGHKPWHEPQGTAPGIERELGARFNPPPELLQRERRGQTACIRAGTYGTSRGQATSPVSSRARR